MADINDQDDIVIEPGLGSNDDMDKDETGSSLDDEFIPEDGEGNIAGKKDIEKDLRAKLKRAIEEKQQYLDGWQRAKADFINARKRDEEAKKDIIRFSNEDLVAQLIPVLESFEMAKANKTAWESIDKNWRMGVEHIQNQLLKILEDSGLAEVNPVGQTFDHNRDEAIEHTPVTDEKQDHVIIEVVQKGYSLNGKLLKAPRVKVGEFKKE